MISGAMTSIAVRAPAKLNLFLAVGPPADDGYHALTTVFLAVSLFDTVTVSHVRAGTGLNLAVSGPDSAAVPADASNLAWQAAVLLARRCGIDADADIAIDKQIPVAAGLAGGSADAAATLVALDGLWGTALDRGQLAELAAELGSDVPFSLHGHVALGTGRGDRLSAVLTRGRTDWVLGIARTGLSTPVVYAELDRIRALRERPAAQDPAEVLTALRRGDPELLSAALTNDLAVAALSLRPELRRALRAGEEAGALGQLISGSGPTVAYLARDAEHAITVAARLSAEGLFASVRVASGPALGPRLARTLR
ncbi:MAG: 4-(cytidine 5'-diphospho)-2-C-methyl-D-erythritol kinase [Geodermatophilaceae bacterium]|nr:4-(cytidine 5'-diphospho)-2-C-methyl-D-erythritol kinase [Geodermatophilaceae bacterium]MDQ3476959.1 4-(cytidine 5'-diphospho)-2-C-methyl-D-erythritol kinase [Actinomycetota bacterium]